MNVSGSPRQEGGGGESKKKSRSEQRSNSHTARPVCANSLENVCTHDKGLGNGALKRLSLGNAAADHLCSGCSSPRADLEMRREGTARILWVCEREEGETEESLKAKGHAALGS